MDVFMNLIILVDDVLEYNFLSTDIAARTWGNIDLISARLTADALFTAGKKRLADPVRLVTTVR
jgi:hypothetical protein